MRICYVLLSNTFGMHQYTADLANRMAHLGHAVHLVTTALYPADRYAREVRQVTPCHTAAAGLSLSALDLHGLWKTRGVIHALKPDVVHITGPHLWNVPLVRSLVAAAIPVVHSIHDLDPHSGAYYGSVLGVWNQAVIRSASHILVHGQDYRNRLLAQGIAPEAITYTPLLHLFLGSAYLASHPDLADDVCCEPWALFFGRLQPYKGVTSLLSACEAMGEAGSSGPRIVVAGPGDVQSYWAGPLPGGLELRNHLIGDDEASDLFRRCGLVVLPYSDATQSALIASAYYFGKPVVVTATGALPEYVQDGVTGRVIQPKDPLELARCLEDMLTDVANLARMGTAGRAWYDARRASETQALCAMYQQLLRHPSGHLHPVPHGAAPGPAPRA